MSRFAGPRLAVLLTLCASCGGSSQPPGSDSSGDASSNPFSFCYDSKVVDLSATGVRHDEVTEYQGSNVDAPTPPDILAKPCASPKAFHIVPHAYKMTRTARLRASGYAANAYLWVQTSCPSFESVCSQNFRASPGDPAVVQSAEVFDAGATVYVLLASGDRGGGATGGDYRLVVEEVDPVPVGGPCDSSQVASPCVAGASCVAVSHYKGFDYDLFIDVFPTRGVCMADGTAPRSRCRADQSCDAPMSCQGGICLVTGTANAACSLDGCHCSTGLRWLSTEVDDPLPGTCKADGQPGGSCHRDVFTCDVGVCGIHGTCVVPVAVGAACDPFQTTSECQGSNTCVAQGSLANSVCVSSGAGIPCGSTCNDSSLACVDSVCVRPQASGGPCFPRQRQDACPTGEVCAATAFSTGSCRSATAEANEPNDSPGQAGPPVSLPAAISGTLSTVDHRDCYAIAVPQGGSVYAELNDGRNGCPYYSIRGIELYDPGRQLIEGSHAYASPCQIIDGAQPLSAARGLAAGNYTLCIAGSGSDTSGAPLSYHLNIAVH